MDLFDEAKRAMVEISQEADFCAKARKKNRPVALGDYVFAIAVLVQVIRHGAAIALGLVFLWLEFFLWTSVGFSVLGSRVLFPSWV